jgi:hypothetical protein
MKKAKRKFNKRKHSGTAFNKSAKMCESEKIKQIAPIPPHKLSLDYVKPKRTV